MDWKHILAVVCVILGVAVVLAKPITGNTFIFNFGPSAEGNNEQNH